MNKKDNTVEEFFNNLPEKDKEEADIFDDKPVKVETAKTEEVEPVKNRRHRRLEQQLQEEREARIRAEALLEGQPEAQRFANDTTTDEVTKKLSLMYGNDKPEGLRAIELHKELLRDAVREAKEEAIKEIEGRQEKTQKEQKQFEVFIDAQLEALEDEYNVDLTSDAPASRKARREFLETVQNLSPKDDNGTITSYADFGGAWEMYQLKAKQSQPERGSERQREIASRSMTRSGGESSQEKTPTPGFNGWRQDYPNMK